MQEVVVEEVIAHVLPDSEWIPEIPADSRDSGGVIEEITGWGFLDIAGFVDGAGNLALMKLRIAGNDTFTDTDIFNPAGTRVRRVSIRPPGWGDGIPEKYDAATVVWQGTNATVFGVTHKAISEANRPSRVVYYVIEGAVVGDPHGVRGLPYDMSKLGAAQEPGTGGPSIDEIRAVVQTAINSFSSGLDQRIKNQTQIGIDASMQRGSLGQAFGNIGISGDSLARAFWQEPFASRYRKLLKDAAYEMGQENRLWGLSPAPKPEMTPDQAAREAADSARAQRLGRGVDSDGTDALTAPTGPRTVQPRRVVGRSIAAEPRPSDESPASPPPDTEQGARLFSPPQGEARPLSRRIIGRSIIAPAAERPETPASPPPVVDSEADSPPAESGDSAHLAQGSKDLL